MELHQTRLKVFLQVKEKILNKSIMKRLMVMLVLLVTLTSCFGYITQEQVEPIKIGMTKKQFFEIVGPRDWAECENGVYEYAMNYESNCKHTLWVTIKNGVVIDIESV